MIFPYLLYEIYIFSQFYVFVMLQNGRRAEKTCFIMLHNGCFPFRTTLPHALTPPERCASPSEYDTFCFSSVVLSPRPSYARFRSKTCPIPKCQQGGILFVDSLKIWKYEHCFEIVVLFFLSFFLLKFWKSEITMSSSIHWFLFMWFPFVCCFFF